MTGRKSAEALVEPFRDQLGQVDDGRIAELSGLSRGVVGAYRRKHGIKAYDGYLWTTGGAAGGRARRGEQVAGRVLANAQPEARPVSKGRTKAARTPPTAAAANGGLQKALRRGPPSKLDAVRHLVGSLSDGDVAARVGLTRSAVQMYRRKHNIPAPSKREADVADRLGADTEPPVAVNATAEPSLATVAAPAPLKPVAPVAPATASAATHRAPIAWRLTIKVGDVEVERYAITADSASVGRLGDAAGEVLRIERVGQGIEQS